MTVRSGQRATVPSSTLSTLDNDIAARFSWPRGVPSLGRASLSPRSHSWKVVVPTTNPTMRDGNHICARGAMYVQTHWPNPGGIPRPPTPRRRPDHKSPQVEATTCRGPRQRGLAGVYFWGGNRAVRNSHRASQLGNTLIRGTILGTWRREGARTGFPAECRLPRDIGSAGKARSVPRMDQNYGPRCQAVHPASLVPRVFAALRPSFVRAEIRDRSFALGRQTGEGRQCASTA
jgi:hypothetical protein